MKAEIKAFDETTLADAKKVVSEMFSPATSSLLDKMLANPLRKELGASAAGEIAYQDGNPVAFQGAILRRLFVGQKPIVGVVGSTLCSKSETSPVLLMQLMRSTIKPRIGSLLFFANTAIPESARLNNILGVRGIVPDSCSYARFLVFKWGSFAQLALKGKLPSLICTALNFLGKLFYPWWRLRRLTNFEARVDKNIEDSYEVFWNAYLERNSGLVASRDKFTLMWMFQEEITSGQAVLISLREGDAIKGYVIAKQMSVERKRWVLLDWIALENDINILNDLLVTLIRYLRLHEPIVSLEVIGYPVFVQRILNKIFPLKRNYMEKVFLYKSYDDTVSSLLSASCCYTWFYGSYDGDRCM